MTNVMADAMLAALPEGGDPLQRLRALVAKMGIQGWPHRQDRRIVLSLARRLGVICPGPTGRECSPVLDIPPAAERVIRQRERAWRDLTRERFQRAVSTVRYSPLGTKVALQAKDTRAGARAIRVLGALGVDPNQVDTEALAWAGRLAPEDVQRLFGKDAALLPEEDTVLGGFKRIRQTVAVILKSRVKRSALESSGGAVPLNGAGGTPLTAPVLGAEVEEAVARELLGDYTEAVARRAAVKRALLALWRQHAFAGGIPQEPPADRWQRLAWLAFVGHALPPVIPARRFTARDELRKELVETGLTANQLCASLEKARQAVVGKSVRPSARASA